VKEPTLGGSEPNCPSRLPRVVEQTNIKILLHQIKRENFPAARQFKICFRKRQEVLGRSNCPLI
jgi:hypothetical protein